MSIATIYYATQWKGNSHQAAIEISSRIAEVCGCRIQSVPISRWDIAQASQEPTVAIFAIGTAGQGDIPFPAHETWTELKDAALPRDYLGSLRFAVFGLGDSKYPYYNFAGRKWRQRLKQLGAREIVTLGLGDEQNDFGFRQELDPWTDSLIQKLDIKDNYVESVCEIVSAEKTSTSMVDPDSLRVKLVESSDVSPIKFTTTNESSRMLSALARVIFNQRMTAADHFQDVRHINVEISHERLNNTDHLSPPFFDPTDSLAVLPETADDKVSRFLTAAHLNGDTVIEIKALPGGHPLIPLVGQAISIRHLVKYVFDVSVSPTRACLGELAQYSDDILNHKPKLQEFGSWNSSEALKSFTEYVVDEQRSMLEVLEDFSSSLRQTPPPLTFWLKHLSPMRVRLYSVANSPYWPEYSRARLASRAMRDSYYYFPKASKGVLKQMALNAVCATKVSKWSQIDLCVAILEFTTKKQRVVQGLCSTYLGRLKPGDILVCGLYKRCGGRRSPIVPMSPSDVPRMSPCLFVSPGTGVAPTRAILQQRHIMSKIYNDEEDCLNKDMVFLGFRHPDKDFLFEGDWMKVGLERDSDKGKSFVAFSRTDETKRKIYVQELLEENSAVVGEHLKLSNSAIFISGKSHPMPRQVEDSLVSCLQSSSVGDEELARHLIEEKRAAGLLVCDTW